MNTNDKTSIAGLALILASLILMEQTGNHYFFALYLIGSLGIIYGMVKNLCMELDKEE